MPDQLIEPARHATGSGWLRDGLLVLGLFGVGGVAAGLVWRWLWTPTRGIVLDGTWYAEGESVGTAFSGTGLYVLVALAAGLLLGVLSGLLADRRELLTLALVVVGSLLAGWVMVLVGTVGVPPDPQPLAAGSPDRARLPGTLEVTGWSPYVAFPSGALAGLCAVFVGLSRKPADVTRSVSSDG